MAEGYPDATELEDSTAPVPLQTNSLLGQKPILTAADKIEKALELKDEGNAFFKSGDYRKASRKYHYALMYAKAITLSVGDMQAIIPGLDSVARKYHSTEEEKSVATELTITLSNNLAACFLKTHNWEKVVTHTDKVLAAQPDNSKALFRRGVANMNLNKTEEAASDLKRAEKINPEDSSIKKKLQLLEKRKCQDEKIEQKMYSAMFKN